MSLHQRCIGNSAWADQSPATKLFLNVLMALSAEFCICICGGTTWKLQFLVQISFGSAWGASLSDIFKCGLHSSGNELIA